MSLIYLPTSLLLLFDIIQEHFVTERNEEPVSLNAFDLISSSSGLNLENLLDSEQVREVPESSLF
jgi:hypothetical protein